MEALADQLGAHGVELGPLRQAITILDKSSRLKRVIRNNVTNVAHRVLTSIEDAGVEARAFCGRIYAKDKFELTHDAPGFRADTCDICLPALRASLQQSVAGK